MLSFSPVLGGEHLLVLSDLAVIEGRLHGTDEALLVAVLVDLEALLRPVASPKVSRNRRLACWMTWSGPCTVMKHGTSSNN
jgi:hypothetical protein